MIKDKRVKKGDILTEGYSTQGGELALGKNLLVAYMLGKVITTRMLLY